MIPSPRSAVLFRCSTCNSVKSLSAASAPGSTAMLVFVVLAVFIAGLMVGRTPEYLGKKIQSYDVKMAMLALLVLTLSILGFAALGFRQQVGTGRAEQ